MKRLSAVMVMALLAAPPPAAAQGGDIPVVSGGIGIAAQKALEETERRYNLKLVFTLVEGNYIADVFVEIGDARGGTVLEHTAGGPFFLAKLPHGSYTVRATFRDKTVTREVKVGGRLRTEYLRWPSDPAVDFPLPPEHRSK